MNETVSKSMILFGGWEGKVVALQQLSQLSPEIAKTSATLQVMGSSIATLSKTMGGDTTAAHPVYAERADEKAVIFDTRVNVQSNELKWIDKADKKVEIEVVFKQKDGKLTKQAYGNNGGEKVTKYVNGNNEVDMEKAAENEFNLWNYSGFEGSFTSWLIPVVKAGGCVRLRDVDKPEGKYYVTGVEIEFGQSGAKRKVTLGKQLG